MNFKVDKGVPVPTPNKRKRTGITAHLRSMKVGESTFITDMAHRRVTSSANYTWGAGNFVSEKRTEKGIQGVRVWRTK